MGRAPRPQGEALTYHVMARGNNRRDIFQDALDRRSFLSLLEATRQRRNWRMHAWCLMTNHVHLLLTTEQADISAGIHDVLGHYARRYNHFHGTSGHLFGQRFRSVLVTSDEQFLTTVRYINRNPVEAGLADRPDRYPWSGYAMRHVAHPLLIVDDADLMERLHPLPAIAECQLRTLVHSGSAPLRVGSTMPTIATLVQAMGPKEGGPAALALGYEQREVAASVGLSRAGLQRHLHSRRTRCTGPAPHDRREGREAPRSRSGQESSGSAGREPTVDDVAAA